MILSTSKLHIKRPESDLDTVHQPDLALLILLFIENFYKVSWTTKILISIIEFLIYNLNYRWGFVHCIFILNFDMDNGYELIYLF